MGQLLITTALVLFGKYTCSNSLSDCVSRIVLCFSYHELSELNGSIYIQLLRGYM